MKGSIKSLIATLVLSLSMVAHGLAGSIKTAIDEKVSASIKCGDDYSDAGMSRRDIECRANPPGRAVAFGNTEDEKFCIRPLPVGMPEAQANRLCDQAFGRLLRGYVATKALARCRDIHKVKCEKVNCETECHLTPVVTADHGVTYDRADLFCPNTRLGLLFGWTASCNQRNIDFDCACTCAPPTSGVN